MALKYKTRRRLALLLLFVWLPLYISRTRMRELHITWTLWLGC